jgi:hypothetical protein
MLTRGTVFRTGLASPIQHKAAGDTAMSKSKKSTTKKSTSTKASDPNLVPLTEAMKKPAKAKGTNGKRGAKGSKPAKKLSALDAAAQVLKEKGEPMNCKAMIEAMAAKKLWTSTAPTPHATLSSAILREMTNKKRDSRFKKTGRGLFAFNQPA